jgi:hypothetical protein
MILHERVGIRPCGQRRFSTRHSHFGYIEAVLCTESLPVADRLLAEKAIAHILVQGWTNAQVDASALPEPTSVAFMRELHGRLYAKTPGDFRSIERDGRRLPTEVGARPLWKNADRP